ncbi:MAG: hypothetical protein Q9159_001065 [Coniocarpon cinnabarinum]
MGLWDQLFDRLGQSIAQILLTRNDIADRAQYLNAQNTFMELLDMGVIPIVNENDTVAVAEILDKFGDNDTLSAITAGMVSADYLFLMTDVDALYDKNPRKFLDAKPIEVVEDIAKLEADTSSAGSSLGTGGMSTKIIAARLAIAAGVTTVITKSSKPGNVLGIVKYLEEKKAQQRFWGPETDGAPIEGQSSIPTTPGLMVEESAPIHTRFLPLDNPIGDRHFWLLHGLRPHGTVYIDPGATKALTAKAGLLPAGIVDVDGAFAQQECVRLVEVPKRKPPLQPSPSQPSLPRSELADTSVSVPSNGPPRIVRIPSSPSVAHLRGKSVEGTPAVATDPAAREVGRAIVNYSATEVKRIAGLKSSEIAKMLGFSDSEYVALRENIALSDISEKPSQPVSPRDNSDPESYSQSSGQAGMIAPAVVT